MFALLPFLDFSLLFLLLGSHSSHSGSVRSIREISLKAVLLIGLFTVITTEALSYYEKINLQWITAAWLGFSLLLVSLCLYYRSNLTFIRSSAQKAFLDKRRSPLLFIPVFFVLISGMIAFLYPPNNYDSLTYHMAGWSTG